jgi:hypothetical protein
VYIRIAAICYPSVLTNGITNIILDKWMPILHPGIEIPTPGKRSPHGYMKACNATLSYLTGYNERTIEGWFYDKSYHYSVGILLRCFHLIFQLQNLPKK